LVESRALARRTVRIVLSVVDWVVLWRQFDHVILVKIRSWVALSLLSREVYAVKDYFLALWLAVQQFFLF
jgi:hypothetical protein